MKAEAKYIKKKQERKEYVLEITKKKKAQYIIKCSQNMLGEMWLYATKLLNGRQLDYETLEPWEMNLLK